jgi:hypothetical protein
MAEGANELIGSPDIDNSHAFAVVEPALELVRLDPGE